MNRYGRSSLFLRTFAIITRNFQKILSMMGGGRLTCFISWFRLQEVKREKMGQCCIIIRNSQRCLKILDYEK